MARFDAVWSSLDATVASGWLPGCVAAIRHEGEVETYATGTLALGSDALMRTDTLFRIASLTKPVGGVLALLLLRDGVFALDDPVERWLPELANPRVLTRIDGPLEDTVPAERPVTVRHLLTMTFGLGLILTDCPLADAFRTTGIGPGPLPPAMSADEFMARIAALPLAFQPGDGWLYHTASDVLAVLLARASGRTVGELLADRITGPLGMASTGFAATEPSRLATAYLPTPTGLQVFHATDGAFAGPPRFEALGSGLVSTVPDYLAFLSALADGVLLPPDLLAAMTCDQLTPTQRGAMAQLAGPGRSWGYQVGVDVERTEPWTNPGRYGWTGGSGTSAFVDPARDVIGVVFTQRMMSRADEPFDYFWGPLSASL